MTNLPDDLTERPATSEPAPDFAHTLLHTLLDGYFGTNDSASAFSPHKGYTGEGRDELVDVIVREIGALLVQNAVDAVPSVADYCRELRRDIEVLRSIEEVQAVLDVDEARHRRLSRR